MSSQTWKVIVVLPESSKTAIIWFTAEVTECSGYDAESGHFSMLQVDFELMPRKMCQVYLSQVKRDINLMLLSSSTFYSYQIL